MLIPSGGSGCVISFLLLIVWQYGHPKVRNVNVSDVVLIQDSNAIWGHWKLAQDTKAEPAKDGIVRDVELRYKLQEPGSTYHGQVDSIFHWSVFGIVIILPVENQN